MYTAIDNKMILHEKTSRKYIYAGDCVSGLSQKSKRRMGLSFILRCVYLHYNNLSPSLQNTIN